MDVISQGQRWRGNRSKIMHVVTNHRHFFGVDMELLCVTSSGRWYCVHIESRWSEITAWQLEPVDPDAIANEMGFSPEIMTDSWRALKWGS